MTSQDLKNVNCAHASNLIRGLSSLWIGFLFAVIFILTYEWRKEVQWQHFLETQHCRQIFRKMIEYPNWDGAKEWIDEEHYKCDDGMIYVR